MPVKGKYITFEDFITKEFSPQVSCCRRGNLLCFPGRQQPKPGHQGKSLVIMYVQYSGDAPISLAMRNPERARRHPCRKILGSTEAPDIAAGVFGGNEGDTASIRREGRVEGDTAFRVLKLLNTSCFYVCITGFAFHLLVEGQDF